MERVLYSTGGPFMLAAVASSLRIPWFSYPYVVHVEKR